MITTLTIADYAVIAGFFAVLLAVGIFYAGRMHNLSDFFSGSREAPWWIAGVSLYMTTFSAFTFVSYSALAYTHGLVAVSIWWFAVPGCLLSAWFLASRWRRAATTSPVEYIEKRFSRTLHQCFSWFGIPLIVLDDALKLFVIGTLIAASTGEADAQSTTQAIAVCGVIIVAYTILGGLWAVLITDCIQFIVMGAAVLVLAPLALQRAGGFAPILDAAPEGITSITAGPYTWPWLLSFSVILALTYATKWPYVQRYYSARSDADARKVGYLVAALTVIAPPLLFFPAVAARTFLPEATEANEVYALVCGELLPAGMMGILLAAMFSATMSMLSSDYNSLASVITNDIVKRLFARDASDRTLVIFARVVTLAVGAAAMTLAILFAQAEQLEDLVQYMARLFAGLLPPVALPMIAGLVSKRTSNTGAITGFLCGAACGITAYVMSYGDEMEYLRTVPYLTWGTLLPTLFGLILGSIIRPNTSDRQNQIDEFLRGLTHKDASEMNAQDPSAAIALRVVGTTIGFIGIVLTASVVLTGLAAESALSIAVGSAMAILGGGAVYIAHRMRLARGG